MGEEERSDAVLHRHEVVHLRAHVYRTVSQRSQTPSKAFQNWAFMTPNRCGVSRSLRFGAHFRFSIYKFCALRVRAPFFIRWRMPTFSVEDRHIVRGKANFSDPSDLFFCVRLVIQVQLDNSVSE